MAYLYRVAVCHYCNRIHCSWRHPRPDRAEEPRLWMGTLAYYPADNRRGRILRLHQRLCCQTSASSRGFPGSGPLRRSLHRHHCALDIGTKEQCTRCILPVLQQRRLFV